MSTETFAQKQADKYTSKQNIIKDLLRMGYKPQEIINIRNYYNF